MSSNIRSVVKNCNFLVFSLCQNSYDIVVLTETWLTPINDLGPLLGIANSKYVGIRCDRIEKKGGGVMLLVKSSFSYEVVFCESVNEAYEILICDIEIDTQPCRFIVLYRAPSCNTSSSVDLVKVISDFCIFSGPRVLLDFNLPDLSSANPGVSSKLFQDLFDIHGFQQAVHKPTRRNSMLDLVLCNSPKLVHDVAVGAHWKIVTTLQLLLKLFVAEINGPLVRHG